MIVDCGRVLAGALGQREILKAADHIVVLTRPDAAGLAHAMWTLEFVRGLETKGTTSFVVAGSNGFGVTEIAEALQADLLGLIPFDPKSAAIVSGVPGRPKAFARGSLVASARSLVDRVLNNSDFRCEANGETEQPDTDRTLSSPVVANARPSLEFAGLKDLGVEAR